MIYLNFCSLFSMDLKSKKDINWKPLTKVDKGIVKILKSLKNV